MSERDSNCESVEIPAVEYRDIEGFPGYRVGDDGSVWSCLRRVGLGIGSGSHCVVGESWRRLRPCKCNSHGHRAVTLGGKPYHIHRLVLEAFVEPCPVGMECRHFPDRDPSNNSVANLSWGTKLENAADKECHGTTIRGEKHCLSVLTERDVIEIRSRCAAGESHRSVAKSKEVSKTQVGRICLRHSWRHVP